MKRYFIILGEPKAKARPRFTVNTKGKIGKIYTSKDTISYEKLVREEYLRQYPKLPPVQDKIPLKMEIETYHKIPKNVNKETKKRMELFQIRPTKKPDVDNLAKIIADSLNGVAYHDDSQNVELEIRKFYSNTPRVSVCFEEIEEEMETNP